MNHFDTKFISLFWGDLLQRFNLVSKYLKSFNIDVCTVNEHVFNLRSDDMFQQYKEQAMNNFSANQYETIYKRKKKEQNNTMKKN